MFEQTDGMDDEDAGIDLSRQLEGPAHCGFCVGRPVEADRDRLKRGHWRRPLGWGEVLGSAECLDPFGPGLMHHLCSRATACWVLGLVEATEEGANNMGKAVASRFIGLLIVEEWIYHAAGAAGYKGLTIAVAAARR